MDIEDNKISEITPFESTIIYANATPNEYTVTLNPDGGSLPDSETTRTVTYDDNYTLPVPTRTGYSFAGWYDNNTQLTDSEGKSLSIWNIADDTELTAKWTINDYVLSLVNSNSEAGTISGSDTYTYGEYVTVSATANEGYSFAGWYDSQGACVSTSSVYTFPMGLSKTLTAKWNYVELTLNYVIDGEVVKTETYTLENHIEELYQYETDDYFYGWYDSKNFSSSDSQYTSTEGLTITKSNTYLYGTTLNTKFNFKCENGGYTITGYRDTKTEIEIPESINGLQVKKVGVNAFINCSSLTSVVIPNSVTSIGSNAFSGCSSLQYNEYGNCYYLGNEENPYLVLVEARGTSITLATISENTRIILDDAFSECSSLTSIAIPNSVTSIGSSAFAGCSLLQYNEYGNCYYLGNEENPYLVLVKAKDTSITSATISENTRFIMNSAFSNCSSLTSIVIPNSVKTIGYEAFYNCISLTDVYYGGILEDWCKISFESGSSNPMYYASHFNIKNSSNEYEEVTEIVIPETITMIGDYQFYGLNNVTKITIPNSVTSIELDAFYGCSSLTNVYYEGILEDWCKINFEDSISNPMYYASHFYIKNSNNEYEEVTEIVIPDTITTIGYGQFYGFNNVTKVTIPDSVTSIGSYAFYGCSSLESITLPFIGKTLNGTSNTHFGYIFGASSYSSNSSSVPTSLKEVIITGGTSIESSAFSGCSSLTSIVIPNSVTSIGSSAFYGCDSLTEVYYKGILEDWCEIGFKSSASNPMYYASHFYIKNSNNEYEEVTEIVIPDTITTIGYGQFYGFNNVTKVTIPDSVTSIGSYAFYGCSSLESITLPFIGKTLNGTSNTHFGYIFGASSYSSNSSSVPTSLKEVIITGGTSIGDYALYYCNKLTSIVIPNSVKTIGYEAFYNCFSLTDVYYGGILEDWCKIKFEYYSTPMSYASHFYIKNSNNEYEEVTEIVIPETITSIGEYQFWGFDNVTKFTIPNSVTSIGLGAFYWCSSLEYNEYGNCYYLGNEENPYLVLAKAKDTSITLATISEDTRFIMSSAFYYCSSLTSIVIPDSVTSIGSNAFNKCSSLTDVHYEGTLEDWCEINFVDYYSNPMYYASHFYIKNSNNGYEEVTEIVIPETITTISDYQFYGFTNVTKITIPNSVTSIESWAFYGCSSLESITLPFVGGTLNGTSNTHFGYIFGASSYSSHSNYVPTSLKEVIITGGTSIASNAFAYCSSLTSVTIPNSVTSIGSSAFSNCSSLTSIVIPDSVTSIGSYAFYGCSSLESITLPFIGKTLNGTSNTHFGYIFGASSYSSNSSSVPTSLKEVIITGGTSIASNAFAYCSSLTSIVIPNSVKEIGYHAFYNCSSLTSIVIPDSVTSIGVWAFYNCSSLTIYCEASSKPSGWDSNWNYSNRPVYWSGQWSYINGVPTRND